MTIATQPSELVPLTAEAARALTEEIRSDIERFAETTGTKLLQAYEHRAWAALGYQSWRVYATVEFGMSQSYAYRLIDQQRWSRAVEEAGKAKLSPTGENRPASTKPLPEGRTRGLKAQLPELTDLIAEAVKDAPEAERAAIVDATVTRFLGGQEAQRKRAADQLQDRQWQRLLRAFDDLVELSAESSLARIAKIPEHVARVLTALMPWFQAFEEDRRDLR